MAADGFRNGWGSYIDDRELHDPRPTVLLNDQERRDWSGNLSPQQVDVVLFVWGIVREYTDGPEDAHERMPWAMSFLEHAIPLTASLFGKGREQVVEMLKNHQETKPSIEAAISPIEHREEPAGGSSRGF